MITQNDAIETLKWTLDRMQKLEKIENAIREPPKAWRSGSRCCNESHHGYS